MIGAKPDAIEKAEDREKFKQAMIKIGIDLPRSIVVTAYQSASGLLNLITPTSVIIMGALAVARTGYDRWFRFVWPLLLIVLVATMILLSLAAFGLGA